MKKKLLLILSLGNISMFAPPKGFRSTAPKADALQWVPSAPEVSCVGAAAAAAHALPEEARASVSLLREESGILGDDERSLAKFAVEWDDLDLSEAKAKAKALPLQHPETWKAVLYEKYHKAVNEQCIFQRFCQALGTKKKYTVLDELLSKGQLVNYIDELNETDISTGDSLLNEALCQGVQDNQGEILMRLLLETLEFKDKLPEETKERISTFLKKYKDRKQLDVAKKLVECLEIVRAIAQIDHAHKGDSPHEEPNLLAIAAAAHLTVQKIALDVATNALVVTKEDVKKLPSEFFRI
jgi:hypothetical protein